MGTKSNIEGLNCKFIVVDGCRSEVTTMQERGNYHAELCIGGQWNPKSRGGHKEERIGAKISYFFLTSDAKMIVLIHTWPLYVRGWAIIIGGIYFFPPEIQNLGRGALLPKQQWRIIGRAHELLHHDDTMYDHEMCGASDAATSNNQIR